MGNGHGNEHGNGHGNGHCDEDGNGKGNRKRKSRERMATWNGTGLGDHIPEIVEITKKRKIAVLGISDSRTKGSGSKQIDSNFVYTWSGRDTHADHEVGFIVDEQHSQAIVEIRPINLR